MNVPYSVNKSKANTKSSKSYNYGCEHQNINYASQLKYKQNIFRECLSRAKTQAEPEKIISVVEEPYFYRNVIRFYLATDKKNGLQYQMHNYLFDNNLWRTYKSGNHRPQP